jgi:nicotinate-nucleotide pyrophosphorylase (carboxylating)
VNAHASTSHEHSIADAWAHARSTGLARRLLELARDEDLGDPPIDATSDVCRSADSTILATLALRQPGVVSGLACIRDIFDVFGVPASIDLLAADGDAFDRPTPLAHIRGSRAGLLRVERTLLNLVGRLSGVATRTAAFVHAANVVDPPPMVLDTRKTTPGLRVLEKYAVVCGGGASHRMGLHDAVLIKDNHIAGLPLVELGPWLRAAAERARAMPNVAFVEVEVDTLDQLDAVLALPAGAIDIVLLDNMSLATLRRAVERRASANADIALEASGGVTLDTIADIARTGVDRISVGGLTHQATSLDVGLDVEPAADDV